MYSKISTIPDEEYDFFIVANGVKAGISRGQAGNFNSVSRRRDEMKRSYNQNKVGGRPAPLFDDVFIHLNGDGSYAIATGVEPDVWPEDESPLE